MVDDYFRWVSKIQRTVADNKNILRNSDVYLFGASDSTKVAALELKNLNIRVSGVIDNNKNKCGTVWMGTPIIPPKSLKVSNHTFVIICGGDVYAKKKQLLSLGMAESNIIVVLPSAKSHLEIIWDFIKAYAVYWGLKKKYRERKMIILPINATGDAYLTGRYIKGYITQNNIQTYVLLTSSKSVKKILELYGETYVDVISLGDMDKLKEVVDKVGESKLNVVFLMFWGLYAHQNLIKIEEFTTISFLEMFRGAVMGMNDEKNARLPVFKPLNEIALNEKIVKGKTVLLAPYASTFDDEIDVEWWEELVLYLKTKNYIVFSNTSSESESVIRGTVGASWKYEELVPILDFCGYFIGVRSGLCEVISSSSCRKIIIYQEYMSKRKMEYFSLKNMGLGDSSILTEIKWEDKKKEQILNDIREKIE